MSTSWEDVDAHLEAIAAGGKTIAVLGTPLDQVYPRQNADLRRRITAEHCAASQFAPGSSVVRGNFIRRNRTMALVSTATVIVEAGDSSGSLSQGWEALRRGRPLFIMRSLLAMPKLTSRPRRRLVASRWLGPADDILLHPAILAAIATWALNDHVLKPLLANAWTGKLSDVVSLAAGPAVLAALLCRCSPWLARHVLALTAGFALSLAAVMASINTLPEAGDAYRWGLGLAQWPWRCAWSWLHGGSTVPLALVDLTMDPTDLWTIPAAAISPWVAWRLHR